MHNEYTPFISKILNVKKHTDIEYTFRMEFKGDVKPGQFFEVSLPEFGEAPISVSGIGEDYVELTIRRVGVVTNEIFEKYEGDKLFLRGPYGNGFDVNNYKGKEVIVVGPPMMTKFTVLEFLKRGIKEENIWISQERKMCCGLGKCGHWKIDDTYICLAGPVFNYTKGKLLID